MYWYPLVTAVQSHRCCYIQCYQFYFSSIVFIICYKIIKTSICSKAYLHLKFWKGWFNKIFRILIKLIVDTNIYTTLGVPLLIRQVGDELISAIVFKHQTRCWHSRLYKKSNRYMTGGLRMGAGAVIKSFYYLHAIINMWHTNTNIFIYFYTHTCVYLCICSMTNCLCLCLSNFIAIGQF